MSVYKPSRAEKWRMQLHLRRAGDARSLSISALLLDSESLWVRARTLHSSPALDMPFSDALRIVNYHPSSNPLETLNNHTHLARLHDIYSRFFVLLVNTSTQSGSTLKAFRRNLEKGRMHDSGLEKEIRAALLVIPQNTPAHALALVLVGLWGIFSGATQAHTALASAPRQEGLASVSAMLSLLYGTPFQRPSTIVPSLVAVDRIALVCIEYVKLVTLSESAESRTQRLEYSTRIRNMTSALRLALVNTQFDDDEEMEMDVKVAKQKLVAVLSMVGRKAAGRATGRDEDSGLEGDLDEL